MKRISQTLAVGVLLGCANLSAEPFIRGDVDGQDGLVMTDAIRILGFLFLGDPESIGCKDAADADDNGAVDISDGIYILSFLFTGGPPPHAPYPSLGFDWTVGDPFLCGDIIGGPQRPVDLDVNEGNLHVPTSYSRDTPAPLVFVLHGDTQTGRELESGAGFTSLFDEEGFLYAFPDGFNAGADSGVWDTTRNGQDSTHLRRVIDDIQGHFNVDPNRIYFLGASSGGHMAYRMACDHSEVIAGILVNSGAMPADLTTCNPSSPVHVLHVHCEVDPAVPYPGGNVYRGIVQLGAEDSVEFWGDVNDCAEDNPQDGGRLDYDPIPPDDNETRRSVYDACNPTEVSVELWTVEKTCHVPDTGGRYPWLTWIKNHPKP
jgi:polyhydroxybutyrate depolymerase